MGRHIRNRVGSEDQKCDVQGHTNGGLRIESRRRIGVHPKNRTGVQRSELVLHEVVTVHKKVIRFLATKEWTTRLMSVYGTWARVQVFQRKECKIGRASCRERV